MRLGPTPRPRSPRSFPVLLALAALALGCHHSTVSYAQPGAGANARAMAVIDGPSGRSTRIQLEVAQSEDERSRGLMFRQHLDPDIGMLFVFDSEGDHPFWMKNTYISLDILFLDSSGEIVGVVEEAEPQSTTPRNPGPSRYVIEVNGGWCSAHGVRIGDRVRLENLPRPPAPLEPGPEEQ